MPTFVSAAELRAMLTDGGEIALLDVREEGVFAESHILLARSLPLSRLELRIRDLVPRLSVRLVVCDDEEEDLAQRAAAALESFGYTDVAVLFGGTAAWAEAGFELFSGFNVPSKAFGEVVEHDEGTPSVSAQELNRLMQDGTDMVVLDSRPWDEYHRMNIPTGIDTPGAELVYRVHDIAPSPETLVVVNCAGRTRSIIGAQSLINAGIPNKVAALRNGTMGWELAGFECERGSGRLAPDPSPEGLVKAQAAAERVARRFGVRKISRVTLEQWKAEADARTLFLLDVRHPHEYEAGHLPGSISAPGGQLVQGTDQFVGTLGARLVLIDDTGVRATMTASWLIQMGWTDVAVLEHAFDGVPLERGPHVPEVPGLADIDVEEIGVDELGTLLEQGKAAVVDLADSRTYRRGHIPGACFAVRSRLAKGLGNIAPEQVMVLTSEDGLLARLAAPEAAALRTEPVKVLADGTAAWIARGLPLTDGPECMADTPDDVWLKPYDHASGIAEKMNEYLRWEVDLVDQFKRDGTVAFRRFPR